MWWLRELAAAAAYNLPLVVSLEGDLDPQLLQQAVNVIVARHEVLRMRFQEIDSGVVGLLTPADSSASIRLQCISTSSIEEAAAVLHQETNTPFDLAAAPPVRAMLISSSDALHVFCLNMHHIATDGWSSMVLRRELSTAYTALVAGRVPQLPPLPVQYSDYAAWQQEVLASDHAAQWRSYWREALLGAPALLQLPCDRPRPAERTYAGGTLFAELPLALEAQLDRLTAAQGVNMQAALLGILQVTN
jgi:hypothetical protein